MKKETLLDMLRFLSSIKLAGSPTDPEFKNQVLQVIAIVDEIKSELDGDSDTPNSTD